MYQIHTTVLKNEKPVTQVTRENWMPDPQGTEMELLNLYPDISFQTLDGFGGAMTEAAAWTISRMTPDKQDEALRAYFGPEGLDYTLCRVHIDSCDFSLGNYSAVTDPEDDTLSTFSLARDEQYILPMLRRAQELSGGKLRLLMSPWSPPAFMKSNGQKNQGGYLLPEFRERWAKYICRYIREYEAMGFQVAAVTVQNEPKAVQKWDSCVYSTEEEAVFVDAFLAPAMKAAGLEHVELIVWDHNKERVYDRFRDILAVGSNSSHVAGVGFHWYSGDHFEGLSLVASRWPDKKLYFTEGCVEYSRFASNNQLKNAQMYAHDILGNLNAGMHGYFDWNLVLDEKGGPNHVGNFCDAPLMCNTLTNEIDKKLSWTYLGHFSRFIRPGAVRVGMTRFTQALEAVAVRNTDGSLVLVVMNPTDKDISCKIRLEERLAPLTCVAGSISTVVIR